MATMMEEVLNKKFSRRDFLKGTVAATAAVAGLGLAGKENNLASAENVAPVEKTPGIRKNGFIDSKICPAKQ